MSDGIWRKAGPGAGMGSAAHRCGTTAVFLTNTDWWLLHRAGRGPPPVVSHRPVPLIQPPLFFSPTD